MADGNAFIFQKSSNKFSCYVPLLLYNFLYADFTVYTFVLSPFHISSSFLSLSIIVPSTFLMRFATVSFSHSNHSLLHCKFHTQFSPFQYSVSTNFAFFEIEFVYNLIYFSFKGISSGHRLSQKLILLPILIFHLIFLSNQFSLYPPSHVFVISSHYHES